jgi:osmotically-inducible protein OsmY
MPTAAGRDRPSDEEQIARRLSRAIEEDSRIRPTQGQLWVEVSDHVVTLEGEVDDIASKRRALGRGLSLPGIRGVVDRVTVRPAAPMQDGAIRDHVRNALLEERAFAECTITVCSDGHVQVVHDPSNAAGTIRAVVHEGTVELEGRVPSLAHMRLVETLAWWVPGTRNVQNRLDVFPLEYDNDDEISDAVRTALEKDHLVDATQLQIETHGGVVVLFGALPSDEQRRVAEHDAWFVHGVREVVNRIEGHL